MNSAQALFAKMYEQTQGGAGTGAGAGTDGGAGYDDDVVDV